MASPIQTDEHRLLQLRKLTEVSRALTYTLSLDEVLQLTVQRAAELLETDKALLMLTGDDGLLSVRACWGVNPALAERFRETLDETLAGRLQGLLGVEAARFLGVPLVVGGEVTGILAVARRDATGNSEEQEWLLSALADQAAVALEKTRLDQTAEFRERLIGIVSHDLRNPLSTILLGTTTLLGRSKLDPVDAKIVARIQSSAERAGRLINDLLDYTQARLGGGIRLKRSLVQLDAIVAQQVEELEFGQKVKRIQVSQRGHPAGLWDGDRIAQVLGNLLSNARQYSPLDSPLRVETWAEPDWAVLAVHNQGEPIAQEALAHIFEPMQRAAGDETSTQRSVGLGLYIVRHLVEAHGGTIGVQSTAEAGTTFTVKLPLGAGLVAVS